MRSHAIYPGSFDPPTLAHADILRQACAVFDKVTVVVARNGGKGRGLLAPDQRVAAWQRMVVGVEVVLAEPGDPITHTANLLEAKFIVRGIRGGSDVEPEQAYREFIGFSGGDALKTVYFMSPPHFHHISSSAARSIVGLAGWRWDLRLYLAPEVIEIIPSPSVLEAIVASVT